MYSLDVVCWNCLQKRGKKDEDRSRTSLKNKYNYAGTDNEIAHHPRVGGEEE